MRKIFIFSFLIFSFGAKVFAQDTLLNEQFSSHELPTGWQNFDATTGSTEDYIWQFNNPCNRAASVPMLTPSGANGFAIFDSDCYGPDKGNANANLISKPVNLFAYDSTATFVFYHFFNTLGDDQGVPFPANAMTGIVYISVDGGNNYTKLVQYDGPTPSGNGDSVKFDISATALGKSSVMVKFVFKGDYQQYWVVDDIRILARKKKGNNINTPPYAANDTGIYVVSGEQVVIDELANDNDPDGSLNAKSVQIVKMAAHGTSSVDTVTGKITYTSASGFEGLDTLIYTVKDNRDGVSNEAMVIIQVLQGTPQGISRTDLTNTLELYPNPSEGLMHVQFSKENNLTLSVFNMQGQLVSDSKVVVSGQDINFSHLKKGNYLFKFSGEKYSVSKFINIF